MGRCIYCRMEMTVDFGQLRRVIEMIGFFFENFEKRHDFGFGCSVRGQSGRGAFQDFAQSVELQHVLPIQFGDNKSPRRRVRQQSFRFQSLQGIANRSPADVEKIRDGHFPQSVAGLESPGCYGLSDRFVYSASKLQILEVGGLQ